MATVPLEAYLAHFTLYGHVNSKNNVFWGTSAPDEVLQRPLHSVRCTAWVAMSKHGIIGPVWFEDENKERYLEVLQQFWTTLGRRNRAIGRNPFLRAEQWFQQDDATIHTANVTLAWLDEKFPDRLISRRRDPE